MSIRHPAAPVRSVLLVGTHLPTLTAARVLARTGWHVIVGDGGEYATVDRSRACHEVWRHPSSHEPEAFLAALADLLARRPDIEVVLPLMTPYVAILAAGRARVPARVAVASPQPDVVATCIDKEGTLRLTREAGLPVRPTLPATDLLSLLAAAEVTGYPCVVRPGDETSGRLPHERKAIICRDAAELAAVGDPWPAHIPVLIVQGFVDGPRHNVYFAAREGRVLAGCESRILRTDRADGTGTNVEAIVVASDPRVAAATAALVARLGYTGVGLAQFLVPRTGDLHFLELNPRHGAGVAFMTGIGLDLITAAVDLARPGGAWAPEPGWHEPVGARYAWLSRDLYGMEAGLARGEIDRAGGRRWFRRALRSAIRAQHHGTWSLRDPLPTLAVYRDLLRDHPWRARR